MPQLHRPWFPAGAVHITDQLAVMQKDGEVTYFSGPLPVFSHAENDVATFRMITSQFCVTGCAKPSAIIRAFGVTSISVKRSVKTYRDKGPSGFYGPRALRGGGSVGSSPADQRSPLCRRNSERLGIWLDRVKCELAPNMLFHQGHLATVELWQ